MTLSLPPGARLLDSHLSRQTAEALLAKVDGQSWRSDLKRRVQHYGWRYDYRARTVSPDMWLGPLPDWLAPLAQSIAQEAEFEAVPDQVIINEYEPGQGISAHIDCAPCFGPAIASLSLTGGAEMMFENTHTHDHISLRLEPRSLLILSGEARYDWTHAIPARKSDAVNGDRIPRTRRVSLTFRTMKLMDNKYGKWWARRE
ncbi:alpha-ketoglutarate-dependent dioxygenase AlkB [Oceanicaulis sp.]|uniref:alpha-ketoglutarate-dependent dioxygenase AlkB n=1 Tax=Oceanicaulis sp. TaxID=1924941 RepID=UPI003F7211EF